MDLNPTVPSKLEPFLLMAKSMKGAAAAKLVENVTSAPGVYVFSEIMDLPNVKALATSETHSQYWALLELFSYKTYQDYVQNKDTLPALNAAQIIKLKHLSIVSLASQHRILPYSKLLTLLDMPTIRELEDLIIDAIYLDVLRGRLDQKDGQLEVAYTMGRDLPPGGEANVLAALKDWATTTSQVLATLDQSLSSLSSQTVAAKANAREQQDALNAVLREVQDGKSKMVGGRKVPVNNNNYGRGTENDGMDVDEPEVSVAKGKARRAAPETTGNTKAGQRKRTRP